MLIIDFIGFKKKLKSYMLPFVNLPIFFVIIDSRDVISYYSAKL